MERRELFRTAGAAAVVACALPALAQHEHHNHAGGARNQSLIDASSACSSAGERCITHCVAMLAGGDKSLLECAATAREMTVVCGGLRTLAAQNSPHLAQYAKLAAEVCKGCEAECRKHAQHPACKECADACAACAAECGKVA